MNTMKNFVWSPLAVLVLLFAMVNTAWGEQVKFTYTGTGWKTTVDNLDDDFPIYITSAEAKGSLGASRLEMTNEWLLFDIEQIVCEVGELEFAPFFSTSVATFRNQSQLFAYSNVGWLCVDPLSGHYYGELFGIYGGGAGKFVGATGEWQMDFDGFFLEPSTLQTIGFRSITGNVKGHFELPK